MRIAIVHDYLNQFGGAERVVGVFHEIFPEAPIYTSFYDPKVTEEIFNNQVDLKVSFMQNLPWILKFFRYYLFLYPLAFNSFDLSSYDVILSSSSTFAKGVNVPPQVCNINYCHTPARFAWMWEQHKKNADFNSVLAFFLSLRVEPFKKWDKNYADKVNYFIANSQTVRERIRRFYGKDSVVINPPIETSRFIPSNEQGDYFLIVSRLNAQKRIDIAIEAFNRLSLPLIIIGTGIDEAGYKKMAEKNIKFLGKLDDKVVAGYYNRCQAFILPGEEDFGMTPLEAMASGRPVIAYKAGGALETIIEGETGTFFDEQTPESLIEAVNRFRFQVYDKQKIRQHALKFDKEIFKQKIKKFVEEKYEEFKKRS